MDTAITAPKTGMQKLLDAVERVGNRVPHPVMIFVYLIGIVVVLSAILALFGVQVSYMAYNPATHEIEPATTAARSLLTIDGIRFMFAGVVRNFMGFNAVGVIIVAMVGVGVAEESGLVKALIRKLVMVAPPKALTLILVLVGILTEITNDAIRLVNPNRTIDLAANLWFSIGSVVLLTVLITVITEKVIEPRLGTYDGTYEVPGENTLSDDEYRGLRFALRGLIAVAVLIGLLLLPPGAPLRNPDTGAMISDSPFMNSLIVSIALVFMVCGIAYGRGAGTLKTTGEAIGAMQKAIGSLGGLILLLLVISQFIAFFNYTNMATLAAVSLAGVLQQANLDALWLLVGFVVVVFVLDLLITAAIAKWAIFAPVFVPLLMQLGVEPEAVLAAYRVGDSPINAITPLNAYFAMIVTFAIRYQKDAGVGTVIALMLPYVLVLSVVWTAFLAGWYLLGLPWGLG